jgi:hypothetical protein
MSDKAPPTQPALGGCVVRVTWPANDGDPRRSQLYDVAISNEDAAVAAIRSFVAATDQAIEVVELLSPRAVAKLALSSGEVRPR